MPKIPILSIDDGGSYPPFLHGIIWSRLRNLPLGLALYSAFLSMMSYYKGKLEVHEQGHSYSMYIKSKTVPSDGMLQHFISTFQLVGWENSEIPFDITVYRKISKTSPNYVMSALITINVGYPIYNIELFFSSHHSHEDMYYRTILRSFWVYGLIRDEIVMRSGVLYKEDDDDCEEHKFVADTNIYSLRRLFKYDLKNNKIFDNIQAFLGHPWIDYRTIRNRFEFSEYNPGKESTYVWRNQIQ